VNGVCPDIRRLERAKEAHISYHSDTVQYDQDCPLRRCNSRPWCLSRLLVLRDTDSKRKVKLKTLAEGRQLTLTLDLLC
jgi:hypothetical protein